MSRKCDWPDVFGWFCLPFVCFLWAVYLIMQCQNCEIMSHFSFVLSSCSLKSSTLLLILAVHSLPFSQNYAGSFFFFWTVLIHGCTVDLVLGSLRYKLLLSSRGQCWATDWIQTNWRRQRGKKTHPSALSVSLWSLLLNSMPSQEPEVSAHVCTVIRPTAALWRKGQVLLLSVQPLVGAADALM